MQAGGQPQDGGSYSQQGLDGGSPPWGCSGVGVCGHFGEERSRPLRQPGVGIRIACLRSGREATWPEGRGHQPGVPERSQPRHPAVHVPGYPPNPLPSQQGQGCGKHLTHSLEQKHKCVKDEDGRWEDQASKLLIVLRGCSKNPGQVPHMLVPPSPALRSRIICLVNGRVNF